MLKIKDNVDLKELEKFGYYYDDFIECWYKEVDEDLEISIFKGTSYIKLIYWGYDGDYDEEDNFNEEDLKYIDDLIKADMVEKVEV